MADIKWCLNVRNGLELVESNENMMTSYLKMAKESLDTIKEVERSKIWISSTSYYTMYYSLYALMMKIGVKCEIHSCSIKFMKRFLQDFYDGDDIRLTEKGFEVRNDLQYYPDRFVSEQILIELKERVIDFFIKTKEIISKITEKQINEIRKKIEEKRDGKI